LVDINLIEINGVKFDMPYF